jgi:hypothetical protein
MEEGGCKEEGVEEDICDIGVNYDLCGRDDG